MKALQVQANKGLLSLEDLPRPEVITIITIITIITTHKAINKLRNCTRCD